MINQLFIDKPPESVILTCVLLLGWTSFVDTRILMRTDLDSMHVADKFVNVINELRRYYLPCKQEKYLTCINTKSVITIVRQLLKTIGYNIRGIEKVIDNKKEMIYKLEQYNKMYQSSIIQRQNANINQGTINQGTINQGTINQGTINQGTINQGTNTLSSQNKFIVCWN